jgi:hypothetical protein
VENEYVFSGTSIPVRLGSIAEFVIISGVDDTGEQVVLLVDNRSGDTWKVNKARSFASSVALNEETSKAIELLEY